MVVASPDSELMERVRAGDAAAFTRLVERYRGAVFRFATHLVPDAAEDVLQETFITALKHVKDLRRDASVKAWLLAIARSKVLQQRSRLSVTRSTPEPDETLEVLARDAGFGAPLSPEELTSRLERQALLERALAAIPEDEREVVVLRDVEGLSGDEAAAAVGLSLPALKSRLHRGRLHLVAALKKEGLS